jgi:hypothetical protein
VVLLSRVPANTGAFDQDFFLTQPFQFNVLSLPMASQPCGTWQVFQFRNLYTVGRTPRTGDQPVATYTQDNINIE